ncbi:hypothetical protein SFRURICE_011159 [Spodoptera frugiperda]|nr:hypothetical protein SFRURICE_011159 [Spodoptera frugiperda]
MWADWKGAAFYVEAPLIFLLHPEKELNFICLERFSTRDVLCYVAVDAIGFHQSCSLVHIHTHVLKCVLWMAFLLSYSYSIYRILELFILLAQLHS